jgi:hypothetical protein
MRQRVFAIVTTGAITAGCYYYQPLAQPDPAPGAYLSATLTDTGADHLSRAIGPDVRAVRGRLLTSDSAALTFSVLGVSLHHGENITWKGEAVTLNREYLAGVEQRKLARGRTVLIVGATVLSVVTTYKIFQGIGLAVGNGGGGGGSK